jgi:hypothetical protein
MVSLTPTRGFDMSGRQEAVMNFGARWLIVEKQDGKSVKYENLEAGISFDCGVTPVAASIGMILEFIISEGDPGDLVFLNGTFYTQTQKEMCA